MPPAKLVRRRCVITPCGRVRRSHRERPSTGADTSFSLLSEDADQVALCLFDHPNRA